MQSISSKNYIFIIFTIIFICFCNDSFAMHSEDNPENKIINTKNNLNETVKLSFEISDPETGDQIITEHLLDIFPIISEKEIAKIIQTKAVTGKQGNNFDSTTQTYAETIYKVSFDVPKNYVVDTAKILWKLNLPEFQSKIYQIYNGKEIYIDTWPNVVGTNKDKTYTGNFQAYKIRNWPFYKDPDPAKASLPPTKPGPGNPLGLFVVHYDENSLRYFHGTNNPKVLNNQIRSLSHGCVRNDNDNIGKMKEFILKRVVKSKDLSGWLRSKKTMIYDFEEIDKFPVQIIYKTYEVDNDAKGKYIMLFKDIYNYDNPGKVNTTLNDPALITLTTTENILEDYRKIFGNDIKDEPLTMMIDYVINSGQEYEKFYIDDLKEKFMVKN
ncbi:MAG: L,D-transpeptidase family protein [Ignavibacteria bacterium]|nr:L,D-transpeptidase family protein [Ignavibacteria bacterium]